MKRKLLQWIYRILSTAAVCLLCILPLCIAQKNASNGVPYRGAFGVFWGAVLTAAFWFLFIQFLPSIENRTLILRRHRICADGAELLIVFLLSLSVTVVVNVAFFTFAHPLWAYRAGKAASLALLLTEAVTAYLVLSVVFWNGILRIYLTSVQLAVRYRVWGLVLGFLFPANLVLLTKMIRIVKKEVREENERIRKNKSRASRFVCKTRYPLLLVHGVFFRDFKQGFLNYWGRIPDELIKNGATVYYGSQMSAASVADCGEELAQKIREIVRETGCGKVNIIAHSKGGLDARWAIAKCGVSELVASLTTINTPHRGCEFADYLLSEIPGRVKRTVAKTYNAALLRLGDSNPDFLAAVTDLTAQGCRRFNEEVLDAPGVYYQSFGSRLKKAGGGRFPLNYSYYLVRHFDGPNDGLVGETSFPWGSRFTCLEAMGARGISHGDMIDLNKENFDGFDVREFYVQIVSSLKEDGF